MQLDDVVAKDGRVWHHFATTPYQRADSTWTELAEWHSACAVCGAPIFARTPLKPQSLLTSHSFDLKHCAAHKLNKRQVAKTWGERMQAAKKAKRANLA